MPWIKTHWIVNAIQCVILCLSLGSGAAQAQQLGLPDSEILTISSDRMYTESQFGQRVAREIENQSDALAKENRQIELELIAEEKDLTSKRPDMEPANFRVLADAFDEKVKEIRRTQDMKARELVKLREEEQVEFLRAARPILADLMQESGASVIVERSSVFLSARVIDVTEIAISRLDATLGEGAPPQKQ